jgi:hypothetical protein
MQLLKVLVYLCFLFEEDIVSINLKTTKQILYLKNHSIIQKQQTQKSNALLQKNNKEPGLYLFIQTLTCTTYV